jgi:peptidoglycan/LPS O-acetylase OafA/YrhL
VRRLFPALLALLCTILALGWLLMLPPAFVALGKHVLASAFYALNFVLANEVGYFDTESELKPLLHLWSLAVEGQFYLVWPLILVLCRSPRAALLVIGAITAGSFIINIATIMLSASGGNHSKMAFFLPHNRIWEITCGGLLAWSGIHGAGWGTAGSAPAMNAVPISRDLIGAIGLAAVLAGMLWLDNSMLNPQAWALLPCLGTLLVIAAGPNARVNRRLLSRPWLVLVGLISYPLYLWHWPLLSLLHHMGMGGDWRLVAIALGGSALLAYGTYRLIETPVRRMKLSAAPLTLLGVSLLAASLGGQAYRETWKPRLPWPDSVEKEQAELRFKEGERTIISPLGLSAYKVGRSEKAVLFVGDSNMQHYWPRIRYLVDQNPEKNAAILITRPGCVPIRGIIIADDPGCRDQIEKVLEFARDPSIVDVVLAASWIQHFNRKSPRIMDEKSRYMLTGRDAWSQAFRNLRDIVMDLQRSGKWVWLILNIPHDQILAASSVVTRTNGDMTRPAPVLRRGSFDQRWLPIREQLLAVARATKAGVVDPMEHLCDLTACWSRTIDGVLIYHDATHLRPYYVWKHASFIDRTIGPPPHMAPP